MSGSKSSTGSIQSTTDLLTLAYQIEIEAVDRYQLLADQMDVCNSPELAALFRKLAHIEGLHAKDILEQAGGEDSLKQIDALRSLKGKRSTIINVDRHHHLAIMCVWRLIHVQSDSVDIAQYFPMSSASDR